MKVTSIMEINKDFVKEFYKNATLEQRNWIKETVKETREKFGMMRYFAQFRSLFVEEFYPELHNKKCRRPDFLEELEKLDKVV